MAREWFALMGSGKQGPFSSAQLKELATYRKILPGTKVKKGADGEWVPASRVSGLFNVEVPTPPPPPPPIPRQEAGDSAQPQFVPIPESPPVQPEFVTLTCPTCSGKLEVTNDVDRFACGYCGNEHMVMRSGGIVSLAPVVQEIKGVKAGVDRTASELAIMRLDAEIRALERDKGKLAEAGGVSQIGKPLLIAAAVMGLFGLGFLGTEAWVAGIVYLIVGALTLVAAFRRMSLEADKHIEREKQLNRAIANKREELAKHRRIVSCDGD
ncbi:MAG: GYF domain-containing protein [Planctomycetota bacterium]